MKMEEEEEGGKTNLKRKYMHKKIDKPRLNKKKIGCVESSSSSFLSNVNIKHIPHKKREWNDPKLHPKAIAMTDIIRKHSLLNENKIFNMDTTSLLNNIKNCTQLFNDLKASIIRDKKRRLLATKKTQKTTTIINNKNNSNEIKQSMFCLGDFLKIQTKETN